LAPAFDAGLKRSKRSFKLYTAMGAVNADDRGECNYLLFVTWRGASRLELHYHPNRSIMLTHLSAPDAAAALGMSESTIKRWCDLGLLEAVRTEGGHRRIPASALVALARARGYAVVRPEVLGLEPHAPLGSAESLEQLTDALCAGDAEKAQSIAYGHVLEGVRLHQVGDELVAPAFRRLGERWQHGRLEIYQERRGVELAARLLRGLLELVPPPLPEAPLAIGGMVQPDPYTLASALVELTLRDHGFRTQALGGGNPGATLAQAILDLEPAVFWLSQSFVGDPTRFLAEFELIAAAAEEVGTRVVVGGSALTAELRSHMRYAAHCDSLGHLSGFVDALGLPASAARDRRRAVKPRSGT
jgi:excisionase family DNA binding protein